MVCAGSDGIHDAWGPYGNADMLERAMYVGDVGGVPEHDRGDDEVEAGGTKLLRLGTAVGNPALFAGLV